MFQKNISIRDFNYHLSEERIAKYPADERDASKLLIYSEDQISEDVYLNISHYLPEGTLLVFNNTKVVEARILFQKSTGATIELFCLEPDEQYRDITTAMLQQTRVLWKCLVGGASKWNRGLVLEKEIFWDKKYINLRASIVSREADYFIIEFTWTPAVLSFAELLHAAGVIPLPPYIKREVQPGDAVSYQTIYARHDGSVAAPTAGLHFTDRVFEKLSQKGIGKEFVTLHVGAGTFKPVKSELLAGHDMHAEFIEMPERTIRALLECAERTIIPVGTTSMRAIESLYWLGVKTILQPAIEAHELAVLQWDAYEIEAQSISTQQALISLLNWMTKNGLEKLVAKTQLMIAPGYRFRMAKAIITNFHQPQSTLLLLVAALIGENWKRMYQYALENDFRFLSYGDGCLIFGEWTQPTEPSLMEIPS